MKLKLLFAIISLSTLSIFSQTKFETGYFILNNGSKTDCLIKNEDWAGSPKTFEYKLSENVEVKLGSIENIKEFGSGESFKYVRATLDVDQSTDVVNNLTDVRNPIMKKETLFLKTLLEGKASLYYSERENISRYFFKVGDGEIEQLIYKRYLATATRIGKNEYYKQQLATNLNCDQLNESNFESLEYKSAKLMKIIAAYNKCENATGVVYTENLKKGKFNLTVRPGVTFSSLSLLKLGDERINFDSKTGFRVGLELEYILPFNNDKWSVFLEPTYRSYKAEKEYLYVDFGSFQRTTIININYSAIELPFGMRHYFFVSPNAAFFIDAAILVDISNLSSKAESSNENSYDLDLNADAGVALGAGFRYKNKYSLELRYHTDRQFFNYDGVDSAFKSFALIAGYNFL